jgi:predicted Zn-dependent protease
MTDRDRLNRQPHRIAVKSVSRSMTLETFLRNMKIDNDLWTRISWLNSRQLSTVLAAGEQVKVIQ